MTVLSLKFDTCDTDYVGKTESSIQYNPLIVTPKEGKIMVTIRSVTKGNYLKTWIFYKLYWLNTLLNLI